MADHMRLSGRPHAEQAAAVEAFIRDEPVLMAVLHGIGDLPQRLLVAGAIYNLVWNRMTGRPPLSGISDIDVFYFDPLDLSWEAEDVVIKELERRFAHLPLQVQARNQARVHLWFPQKFNQPFAPLTSAVEMLSRYASKTHAVAASLDSGGRMTIHAPFGLEPIFGFRVVPNHVLDNRPAHETKGARAKAVWPELTIEPW